MIIKLSITRRFTKQELAQHIRDGADVDNHIGHKRLMANITKRHVIAFGKAYMGAFEDHGEDTDRFYDDVDQVVCQIREEIRLKLFP